jgi:uncharacterized membrane protein
MKRFFSLLGTVMLIAFLISSCTKSNGETSGSTDPGTSATPGNLFTAVKTMMAANCAVSGCHTGSVPASGLNFGSDNTIVAQKDRIKTRAVEQAGTVNQMPQPPNAPLSASDQKKITDWIAAGGRISD